MILSRSSWVCIRRSLWNGFANGIGFQLFPSVESLLNPHPISPLYTWPRPPCHLWPTRKWWGRAVVAETQKALFLCNCCRTTLVSSNGGRVEAVAPPRWLSGWCGLLKETQWWPQWSLNGSYWSAKGGTMVVKGRQKRRPNWYTMFTTVRIFYGATNGRSLCIISATTVTIVPLFWTCAKLHGDHGVHGDVWTSCVPPLNDQGKRSASFLPSTATWPFLWSHKEAQSLQPLCKGGIRCYSNRLPIANTWWRHQMETFSAWLALCVGISLVSSHSRLLPICDAFFYSAWPPSFPSHIKKEVTERPNAENEIPASGAIIMPRNTVTTGTIDRS